MMRELGDYRESLKMRMKSSEGAEKIALESQQWAIKIVRNIQFGAFGSKGFRYGDISAAMVILAMGRMMMSSLINNFKCGVEKKWSRFFSTCGQRKGGEVLLGKISSLFE